MWARQEGAGVELPARHRTSPLLVGVAIYAGSKLFEVGDAVVLAAGGIVSGHTIKHVLAAIAAAFITRWLTQAR